MNFDPEKHTLYNVSSKIPTPVFSRSASFRVPGEKGNFSISFPNPSVIAENSECNPGFWKRNLTPLNFSRIKNASKHLDDDLESVGSVPSNFSTTTGNSACDHAHFAKNGTTFSGKSHKYIVHCSSGVNDPDEYLTPTQRANRNIKRLKTLLHLAKEKLREKEEEISKLNKEVVELKLFKANVESANNSPSVLEKDPLQLADEKDFSPQVGPSHLAHRSFINEKFCEISPIKHMKNVSPAKMSPAFSLDGFGEKTSVTPDFLLSSLADSGNFDDLPSSASIYSKDSVSFVATPELKLMQDEQSVLFNDTPNEEAEEKLEIVRMYEKKLGEKKLEYEAELNRVVNEQEERNMKIIHEFEKKLKEEELKFESRWNELLKATEEEKMMIVSRFEEKLEEEKEKYKENLSHFKLHEGKVTDMVFEMTYSQKMEEEKNIYETSLVDIKEKFEKERAALEEKFDEAMKCERMKFEENLKRIKDIGDQQVAELSEKVSELEAEYFDLLPKYEQAMSRTDELEKENESLKSKLKNQEETQRKIYLEIYNKGPETVQSEMNEYKQDVESSGNPSKKISVPELFAQLKITEVELENLKDKEYREAHSENLSLCLLSSKEAISLWMLAARKAMYKRLAEAQAKSAKKEKTGCDPEATLQFLKSAVYYFLTDRENHLGHLKAIESILAFSSTEKDNIEKYYMNSGLLTRRSLRTDTRIFVWLASVRAYNIVSLAAAG